MFITNKFIYFHNRHCGGHTVRNFLNSVFPNHNKFYFVSCGHWHKPIRCLYTDDYYGRKVNEIKDTDKDKLSFAYIRNPWEWYVSFFFHQDKDNEFIINYCPKTGTFKEFLTNILDKKYNKKINNVLFWPPGDSANHVVPKAKFLSLNNFGFYTMNFIYMFFKNSLEILNAKVAYEENFDQLLTIDKLFKVEDGLDNGMRELFNDVNIICPEGMYDMLNNKLGHKNRKHYSEYYDDEMTELVYNKDKFLIEKYEWKFETS